MGNIKAIWEAKWNEASALLKSELLPPAHSTWVKPLVLQRVDEDKKTLYFSTDNALVKEFSGGRYRASIDSAICAVFGEGFTYSVSLGNSSSKDSLKSKPLRLDDEFNGEFIPNPRFNFDTFVVGPNNIFAHSASLAVAENPVTKNNSVTAYNPLFLYGGSGLGKTHLMHAIGHHILKTRDDLKVLYVSSEVFTNELVNALRKNELHSQNNMGAFRNKYRNIDVLLIDDIQFLEDKEHTQVEFFNTFETLYSLNKQIIISSDRPPNKLVKMDERLRSRFQWSLVADISAPDYETRVAILLNKAELQELVVTDEIFDVLGLIASGIKGNVRELEGAFLRIVSFSQLMGEKIDISFARKVLKDIVSETETDINPEKIKRKVCNYFNIKISDMESSKRTRNITYPRQIAMFLCRDLTNLSLPKIGEFFGKRDHTTVIHACEKISKEIEKDKELGNVIEKLKGDIYEK